MNQIIVTRFEIHLSKESCIAHVNDMIRVKSRIIRLSQVLRFSGVSFTRGVEESRLDCVSCTLRRSNKVSAAFWNLIGNGSLSVLVIDIRAFGAASAAFSINLPRFLNDSCPAWLEYQRTSTG